MNLVAAIAEPDIAHANAVIGAQNSRVAQRRTKRCGAREITSRHVRHRIAPYQNAKRRPSCIWRIGLTVLILPNVEEEPALVPGFDRFTKLNALLISARNIKLLRSARRKSQ